MQTVQGRALRSPEQFAVALTLVPPIKKNNPICIFLVTSCFPDVLDRTSFHRYTFFMIVNVIGRI